jgi:hypothetical protein
VKTQHVIQTGGEKPFTKLKTAAVVGLNYNSECESLNYFSVVFIINFMFFTDYFIPSWDTSVQKSYVQ